MAARTGAEFGNGRVTALSPAARDIARLEELATTAMRERLRSNGLSMREMSRRSGVPINTLRSAMNDGTTPGLGNLLALARGLGVSLDQLFVPTAPEQLASTAADAGERSA